MTNPTEALADTVEAARRRVQSGVRTSHQTLHQAEITIKVTADTHEEAYQLLANELMRMSRDIVTTGWHLPKDPVR